MQIIRSASYKRMPWKNGGSVLDRECVLPLMTQMRLSTLVPLRVADLSVGHGEAA